MKDTVTKILEKVLFGSAGALITFLFLLVIGVMIDYFIFKIPYILLPIIAFGIVLSFFALIGSFLIFVYKNIK